MTSSSDGPQFDRVRTRSGGRNKRVRDAVLAVVHRTIVEEGYSELSHRKIAAEAKVDPATIYRRWPTRAQLVADLFLSLADRHIPVPDTGAFDTDMEGFLRSVVAFVSKGKAKSLTSAFFAASIDNDAAVSEAMMEAWRIRFENAYVMFDRAIQRGELLSSVDKPGVIEALVAPVWFRLLVTRNRLDDAFVKRVAKTACRIARL